MNEFELGVRTLDVSRPFGLLDSDVNAALWYQDDSEGTSPLHVSDTLRASGPFVYRPEGRFGMRVWWSGSRYHKPWSRPSFPAPAMQRSCL